VRLWQTLHLSATARGLALQPLNQPIETIDRERQTGGRAQRIAGLTGDVWQATFAFRAGYASRVAPPSAPGADLPTSCSDAGRVLQRSAGARERLAQIFAVFLIVRIRHAVKGSRL
jgi:hypothetical protein